jgi:hypothetical protein
VWPELFGEVELDLAQAGLITDLDRALDTHSLHFLCSAIARIFHDDIDGTTWMRKAVRDVVRRRSADLQDPDVGRAGGAARPPRA